MTDIPVSVLCAIVEHSADPVLLVNTAQAEWPVCLANAAFRQLAGDIALEGPLADACEALLGRDAAMDISEAVRSREATRIPIELSNRECILGVTPLEDGSHVALYLRDIAGGALAPADAEMAQALLKAKKRVRDLDRDDPVTGLMNERAFRDMLAHDWAVAVREKSTLALVRLTLVDFDAYVKVFGRHASDSCLRRVGTAIRRCLRRASDIVARLDDASFVVLSHASDEANVRRFAETIATAVRDLGIHHPRSSEDKYVTVRHQVVSTESEDRGESADAFLRQLTD